MSNKNSVKPLGRLAELAASVVPDEIDCDRCLASMAEFLESAGKTTDELARVHAHLTNCHCCREEYQALRAAKDAIDHAS
jgi:alkylhydroperoxidase family enzyme